MGGGTATIKAQTPLARFVLPTNTTETAVQPTFRIITRYPIDTSSVRWNWNWIDSTHVERPSIVVLPHDFFGASSDTEWQPDAMPGTGVILNDTTLEFTPDTLPTGFDCEAIVMGLRLISGPDTILISDTVGRLAFTTIDLPPRLTSISLFDSGGTLRIHDTITARFSKKLDSASTPGGPLCEIIIRTITLDTTGSMSVSDSSIPMAAWLDASDSSVIRVLPTAPYEMGQRYLVKVNVSRITGDSSQDLIGGFVCRKSYRLNIVAQAALGLTSLAAIHFMPAINEQYKIVVDSLSDTTVVLDSSIVGRIADGDDTLTYSAPQRVGCAQFWKWSCPGYPAIDTSTDTDILITQSPDQLYDMTVSALYVPIPVDSVVVGLTTAMGGHSPFIEILSDSQECHSLVHDSCSDTCTYLVERYKAVNLYANPDGLTFSGWSSSDANVDGSTSEVVTIQNASGNEWAIAHFGTAAPPVPGALTADIEESNKGYRCSGGGSHHAYLVAPTAPTCSLPTGNAAVLKMTTLGATWGLKRVDIYKGGVHTYNDFGGVMQDLHSGTYSVSTSAGDPNTDVVFTVAPLNPFIVTVVVASDDGEMPNGTNFSLPNFLTGWPTNFSRLCCFVSPQPSFWKPGPPKIGAYAYDLTYPAGTDVTLLCAAFDGSTHNPGGDYRYSYPDQCYRFVKWEDANPPNTDNNGTTSSMTLSYNPLASDHHRYVTAIFHMPLRPTNISFIQWPRMTGHSNQDGEGGGNPAATGPIYPPPLNIDNLNLTSPVQGVWGTGTSTWTQGEPITMTVTFNKKVKMYNILSGFVYPAIAHEATPEFGRNQIYNGAFGETTTATSRQIITITFNDIQGTGHTIWKGQNLDLSFYSNVVSAQDGEALCHDVSIPFSTENPDISWYYDNTNVKILHNSAALASDCSGTYWMAHQHSDGSELWTAEATCIRSDVSHNTVLEADCLTGWTSDTHNWSDEVFTLPRAPRLMISCPHCSDFNYPSAGIQNVVTDANNNNHISQAWYYLWSEIRYDAAGTNWNLAPQSLYMAPTTGPTGNLDQIATKALQNLAVPQLAGHIGVSYNINCAANFPEAHNRSPLWWGAVADYPKTKTKDSFSTVTISVSLQ